MDKSDANLDGKMKTENHGHSQNGPLWDNFELHLPEIFTSNNFEFTKDSTLVDLFYFRVTETPNNIAVVFKKKELSYIELDRLSNQFVHFLIEAHGISPGNLVGITLERSEWLIVLILGVLKAGAAYVPIDTQYPEQRKKYIKKDSQCTVNIDASFLDEFLIKKNKYATSRPKTVKPQQNDVAYIIYTSGSTGNPKGVIIEHRSLLNYLLSSHTYVDNSCESSGTFAHLSTSFDASITEIFLPLIMGKCLVLSSKSGLEIFEDINLSRYAPFDFIKLTPSHISLLTSEIKRNLPRKTTSKFIIGGEALFKSHIEELKDLNIDALVINEYGPTETTVGSSTYTIKLAESQKLNERIPIGVPISNTDIYILDNNQQLLPDDEVGEICIGGNGLARGYINQQDLTSEKFVSHPFLKNKRIYLTGDLGRRLPDGNLEFLGRKDNQVKIRGYRIELEEIEKTLGTLPNIKRAAVIVSNELTDEPKLMAYMQSSDNNADSNVIRNQLKEVLPHYMVPSIYMWLDDFPLTNNGKIDKKGLPLAEYIRPDSAPLFRKPRTKLEKEIAKVWSEKLQIPDIGLDDNFFEVGGTSLLTQKVAAFIQQHLRLDVSATKIYRYPTISALLEHLKVNTKSVPDQKPINLKESNSSRDIAIIGMAGRFPGASNIDELWEVLIEGRETISFFTPEELDATIPEYLRNDSLYVKARGIVPSAKEFDASFFGLNPKLAEAMDPQQRLFLEIAWEVLEQTGHLSKHYNGSIGVYAGTGINTYYKNNVLPNKELLEQVGHLQADTVNEKDYVASRTSYHLNLKGPAVSIHSACSTSLLAIAEAVEAIRHGQCDVALAGGSSVTAPMNSGHLYQEGSMLSPDGHCRSFDKEGKGTVFSDGAGVVLLKSLDAARKDGDFIYGLIKGVGLNNDGGNKGSFTAPSVEGQSGAISKALHDAQISPSSITYVEAHGTATPLGDPIEIEGLRMAFGEQNKNGYCALGSIKSNMGHLTAAAGVAGLIKTVLAMNHRLLPPSLGYSEPNPSIDFKISPFFVNNKLRNWEVDDVRKAGISSFGVGGTNVHVVLEEYVMEPKASTSGRPLQILPWSAKTKTSLERYGTSLGKFLEGEPSVPLADVAYSLNMTRESFSHRRFVLADTTNTASQYLLDEENKAQKSNNIKVVPNEIVFLFPGQGAQYIQMGRALYEQEKVFTEAVDTCAELLMEDLKCDIRQIIFPNDTDDNTENRLKETRFTQPALFVIEYALSRLWVSWGIKPTLICGHSIGEFVAAHLAGIFSLNDALRLITIRGRLVSELPEGDMLSVRMTPDDLSELLPNNLSIAAINSDRLCVVAGHSNDIEDFAKILKEEAIPHMLLATSHAFHSTMMDPVLEPFRKEVEKITLKAPRIPLVSTVTGKWLTEEEALNPEYWADHLRATVRFTAAMDTILSLEDPILLEVGPGNTLTTLARQKKAAKGLACIASLPVPKNDEGAYSIILNALGELWLQGLEPDWLEFHARQSRQKVRLPAYAFDRKPCWVAPPIFTSSEPTAFSAVSTEQPAITENSTTVVTRKAIILQKISELIANASGIELEADDKNLNFLELGLDSLILTQIAITCKREFDIPISFRQLNEEFSTPGLLAAHLDQSLPADVYSPSTIAAPIQSQGANLSTAIPNQVDAASSSQDSTLDLIAQQLQNLGRQVELLRGSTSVSNTTKANRPQLKSTTPAIARPNVLTVEEKLEHNKPFGAAPRIERKSTDLKKAQQEFLGALISRYNKKTISSKNYAQKHRAQMSDPRVVTGFKPQMKELIYPLVVEKSSGNRLWDLDGNEYIDALNGFGSCLFGHQPDFIKEALHKQVELGFEVGPQHPLAGEVCDLLCEFTDHERAALCNTGSEAVLGAMRIARTVTGRSLIVAFSSSYHGINDEVIVRGSRKLKTFPAAPGILPEAVQNMLILDYGTDESLQIIRDRAHEFAAVLVEPIQSRRPELQPIDFLRKVRDITASSETALIFDEIITGFRMHPGGVQALFDIKADIATYGKVIGGGISIGAIVGKRKYMDALDGGFWQYGDNSYPEVGVTYFAGTFVRHPLALATTKASLNYMKEQGPDLQNKLTAMTESLAFKLNTEFIRRGLPIQINHFGSLWRLKFKEEIPNAELLFVLMREKGIHIWDGFPCYMTVAYTEKDISVLISAFISSIDELVAVGIFHSDPSENTTFNSRKKSSELLNNPPLPGARLGRDRSGNPAWFIADKQQEGEYLKINL